MYENYQENLLDKCNQRLMCCDQKLEELHKEIKKVTLERLEASKLQQAIKEVK